MQNEKPPVLPPAWADVLDGVARALAQTEANAARAEESLTAQPSPPPAEPAWQQACAQLAERLRRLQTCVAQAEQTAAQAEASLQQSEDALKAWLAEAEAARGRLANRATSAVS